MHNKKEKKLKAPIKPIEPYKPIEPKRFLEGTKKQIAKKSIERELISFKELVQFLQSLCKNENLEGFLFTFEGGYDYYDDYISPNIIAHVDEPMPNQLYERQLKYYKESLSKYEKDKIKYDKAFVKYEKELKEYESTSLQRELEACEKKLKKLRKQLNIDENK